MYVALRPMLVGEQTLSPGDVLPNIRGGWGVTHLVRMQISGHVARVTDGHEKEFCAALRRGCLPTHLAPQAQIPHLATSRLYMREHAEKRTDPSTETKGRHKNQHHGRR